MAADKRCFDVEPDSGKKSTWPTGTETESHIHSHCNNTDAMVPEKSTDPFEVSADTLLMMDRSIVSFHTGEVSGPVDLSDFED